MALLTRTGLCVNRYCSTADFRFFKMAAAATLDFRSFKFLTVGSVKRVELRQHTKFCWNRPKRGRDITIYRFFKMAATAILDFKNFNFRNGQDGRSASPCQISSKSVQPRLKYGDFSIFQDGGRRHLGFSKFQIFDGGSNYVTTPNFVEIGPNAAEILRFIDFSRWRPPPSWIVKISNF